MEQLPLTGYDEVSLLSLSSSDYPDISSLMIQLSNNLRGRRVDRRRATPGQEQTNDRHEQQLKLHV